MSEVNEKTSVSVNGTLTVSVVIAGHPRRYRPPGIKAEIPVNFGGDLGEFEALLEEEFERVKHSILVACGQKHP